MNVSRIILTWNPLECSSIPCGIQDNWCLGNSDYGNRVIALFIYFAFQDIVLITILGVFSSLWKHRCKMSILIKTYPSILTLYRFGDQISFLHKPMSSKYATIYRSRWNKNKCFMTRSWWNAMSKVCMSNYILITRNWQTAAPASVHPQYPVMNLSCAFFFQWGKINNGNTGCTGVTHSTIKQETSTASALYRSGYWYFWVTLKNNYLFIHFSLIVMTWARY